MARRNFGLDALRVAAISLVLFNHALGGFLVHAGKVQVTDRLAFVSMLTFPSIEWLFVLSGLLIGTMMIRSFESEKRWWDRARSFWLRRWFRTVPNYYLFLGANIALVAVGLDSSKFSWRYLFFAQNLLRPEERPVFFFESWTLALDEWFYLVLPLLAGLFALARLKRTRTVFLLATAVLIVVPVIVRLSYEPPQDFFAWDIGVRRVTIAHLDATGWGVMAAVLGRWFPGFWAWRPGLKALIGLALMSFGIYLYMIFGFGGWFFDHAARFANGFNLTFIALGTVLIIPWLTGIRAPGEALARGAASLSNYTYSIYLSHYPLVYVLRGVVRPSAGDSWLLFAAIIALWLALVLGLSALVFHTFEKPVSDLRERYTKRVDANPFGTDAPPP